MKTMNEESVMRYAKQWYTNYNGTEFLMKFTKQKMEMRENNICWAFHLVKESDE